MKTVKTFEMEEKLLTLLDEMELYEFIVNSFNIILSPSFWVKKYDINGLDESTIRKIVLNALTGEFGDKLSNAETPAEKALKKACSYVKGMYEVVRLRLMLFHVYENERERIVFLLNSNIESQRFGGLCSLRLNKFQAEALMPIAKEIGNFISEKYNLVSKNSFPEEEIIAFLEQADDKEIERIAYLINSGEESFIHGGLKSLMLSKPQCEACKEEGIDSVLKLIKKEQLKRESSSLIHEFKKARENLDAVKKKLESAGFEYSEIQKMLECTKAYERFKKIESRLKPEVLAIAIA